MIKEILKNFINQQEGRFILYLPIFFACGIVIYFALPFEPVLWISLLLCLLCLLFFIIIKTNLRLLFLFLLFFFAGFTRINLQTTLVQEPFIHKKYNFVTVEGRVEKLNKLPNAQKVVLTDLKLNQIPTTEKPLKIRIKINGLKTKINTGDTISLKATLMPPTLPFLPEGYPYARTAFYERIGAIGYATSKITIIKQAQEKESILENIRSLIQQHITTILPPDQAAIATALITGNQGLVTTRQRELYTTAGIVHILSVSGFHMALMATCVFFIFRWFFMFIPILSQKFNTKKICAFIALLVTFMYLLISGMGIPALRSFGMIALVLIGIICDRKAVSLYSVFWIAFLLLMIAPETLMSAGFALSFGAVITLIACHELFFQRIKTYFDHHSKLMRFFVFPLLMIMLMNLVAHLATAPIVIYHFHRYANYTILGNLIIAPIFALFIIPTLFLATFLLPFGLSYPFFWIAGFLLYQINQICEWIVKLPFSNFFLPPLSDLGYVCFICGVLILFLIKGKFRIAGLLISVLGLSSLLFYEKPDILINQGGSLWAFQKENRFVFSSIKKQKTTRKSWLEAMGENPKEIVQQDDSPYQIIKNIHVRFDGNTQEKADIVFNSKKTDKCSEKICISRKQLWKEGTHAVYIKDNHFKITSAGRYMGNRPWCQGVFVSDSKAEFDSLGKLH